MRGEYKYAPIGNLLYPYGFGADEVAGNAAFMVLANFFYYDGFSMLIFGPSVFSNVAITLVLFKVYLQNKVISLLMLSALSFMVLVFIPRLVCPAFFIPLATFVKKVTF